METPQNHEQGQPTPGRENPQNPAPSGQQAQQSPQFQQPPQPQQPYQGQWGAQPSWGQSPWPHGWNASWHPGGPRPPQQSATRDSSRSWPVAIVAIVALLIAVGAGFGLGHAFWPGTPSSSATSNSAVTAPPQTNHGDSSPGNQQTTPGENNQGGNSQGGNGQGNGTMPELPGNLFPGLIPGGQSPQSGGGSSNQSPITSAPGSPDNISDIVSKVAPGIVDVNATFQYQRALGAGTGIVLTSDGEVLTNNHVIDGATSISVTDLGNGKTYSATVVGYDSTGDVAVLQLKNASGLTTATLGDSSSVEVGDAIVGIGNAEGRGGTPSAAGGSVTALNQSISVGDEMYGTTEKLNGLIETNAAIQSGDSGGPMVTQDGTVIGMDTAASVGLANTSSGHEGYAIPINTAKKIVKTIDSGHSTDTVHVGATAALGILVATTKTGGPQPGSAARGALVTGVVAGGAGAKAGLAAGDVITSFDGHSITSAQELSSLMTQYQPGDSVTFKWTSQTGDTGHATVELGTGPAA